MAQPFDICIRGAGIVGRTLALLLARDRLRVALMAQPVPGHHSDPTGHGDVRAYALNAASRHVLETLRCWPDDAHATAVAAMQVFGDDGGEVNFRARQQHADALAWIVDVPALEARLREAVRYQPMVEEFTTPSAAPVKAALTVVCEGRASATREEFGAEFDVTPYAQQAIATRLSCSLPHGQVARQWFAGGAILAFLPLDGAQGNSVAVVWSVNEARATALLALAPEEFAQALHAASHGALGDLQLSAGRAAWPLQRAQARHWIGRMSDSPGSQGSQGSWALAGDAAHTVHPLAGQGLNLGLGDAAELARVLHAREYWRGVGDEKLLRRYERARKAAVLAIGSTTDGLQQLFSREEAAWQGMRNWGMKGFERSGIVKAWVARQAMGAGR